MGGSVPGIGSRAFAGLARLAPIGGFRVDRRGAVAIEFLLGMIPMTILALGGVTYGGVFASLLAMNHAANEGARAALAGHSLCERQQIAVSAAHDALGFADIREQASISSTVTADGIRVDIAFPYAAAALTPVVFPVPATLAVSALATADGPEPAAVSC